MLNKLKHSRAAQVTAGAVAAAMVLSVSGMAFATGSTPITSGFATETTTITADMGLGIALVVLAVGLGVGIRVFAKLVRLAISKI